MQHLKVEDLYLQQSGYFKICCCLNRILFRGINQDEKLGYLGNEIGELVQFSLIENNKKVQILQMKQIFSCEIEFIEESGGFIFILSIEGELIIQDLEMNLITVFRLQNQVKALVSLGDGKIAILYNNSQELEIYEGTRGGRRSGHIITSNKAVIIDVDPI